MKRMHKATNRASQLVTRVYDNRSVVTAEEQGYARELVGRNRTTMSDVVRDRVQRLSVLEVIS